MATLLLAEIVNGQLSDMSARALTAARQIGAPVEVLVAGQNCAAAAATAAKLEGVAKVRVADGAAYAHGLAEPMAALIVALSAEYGVVIAASSAFAKNLGLSAAPLADEMWTGIWHDGNTDHFEIVWRDRNVVAIVQIDAFVGASNLGAAYSLAAQQEQLIDADLRAGGWE